MNDLRFIDAFSGIGGFRLAADQFPLKCVNSIEFDRDCQYVYEKNFGEMPLGDITKIDLNTLADHDLLFAGFPCQPFSRNGKYNHNNGEVPKEDVRKDLYLYLIEILKLKKPKYFIFENVKELQTIKHPEGGLFLNRILEDLENSGYKVYSEVLNSNDFGLAQQRNRLFFVGVRKDLDKVFKFPKGTDSTKKVKDILELEVDETFFLKYKWQNRVLTDSPPSKKGKKLKNHTKTPGTSRLEALEEIYKNNKPKKTRETAIKPLAILYGDTPSGLPRQQDKIYSIEGVCPTLTTFELVVPAFAIEDSSDTWRILTPRECARLQGFPDSFKLAEKNAVAYKQLGNAVSPPVVVELLRSLLK